MLSVAFVERGADAVRKAAPAEQHDTVAIRRGHGTGACVRHVVPRERRLLLRDQDHAGQLARRHELHGEPHVGHEPDVRVVTQVPLHDLVDRRPVVEDALAFFCVRAHPSALRSQQLRKRGVGGHRTAEAIKLAQKEFKGQEDVAKILTFMEGTKRGISRAVHLDLEREADHQL